jgi:hypothetical protein
LRIDSAAVPPTGATTLIGAGTSARSRGGHHGQPAHHRHVQRDGHQRRVGQAEGLVQQRQAVLGADLGQPAPLHALDVERTHLRVLLAALLPQPPRHGQRRQAQPQAVRGQRVQDAVRGGVVRLPGAAERRGTRGVEDERGQVQFRGQLVEVPRGVGLRRQHRLDPLARHRGQRAVVEHTGGVEDAGQRVLRRHRAEQPGDRVAVADVAGHDRRLGAELGEGPLELGRAGGVGGPGGW